MDPALPAPGGGHHAAAAPTGRTRVNTDAYLAKPFTVAGPVQQVRALTVREPVA